MLFRSGTKSNRDAIGAKLEVTIAGLEAKKDADPKAAPFTIYRQRKGGYSMQATNDPRVTVGIGQADVAQKVVIRWPSGKVQTLENLKADQEHKVVEPK